MPPTCAGDGGLDVKEIDWMLRSARGLEGGTGLRAGGFAVLGGSVEGVAGWSAVGTGGGTCGRVGSSGSFKRGAGAASGAGTPTASGRRSTTRLALPPPLRNAAGLGESRPSANAAPEAEPGVGKALSSIPSKAL